MTDIRRLADVADSDYFINCPACGLTSHPHECAQSKVLQKYWPDKYDIPSAALPTDAKERKALPLYTYMFEYFPLAWLEEVKVAVSGNAQHDNPVDNTKPIHWDRSKSTDQLNTAFRHLVDYGTGTKKDTDGNYHLAKAIWRLKAQLQLDIEADLAACMSTRPATVK